MQFDSVKKYYVYVWFYVDTEKIFYVGKGTKYRYRSRKRDNAKLVEILNTCQCDSKIIKDGPNEEEAFQYEKDMISYYRKAGHPLINIQDGGYKPPNHSGVKRSEKTKALLSKSLREYYTQHPEVSEMQSKRMKAFFQTDEGKLFQAKSKKSRQNDEFRRSQSIRCRKANQNEEYVAKQSARTKEMWKSQAFIDAHTGANNGRAQAVRQYDLQYAFVAEYPTMTDASRATGVSVSKISLVAKGKRKTSGGYIWEYVNEKKFKSAKASSFVYDADKDKNVVPILQYDMDGNFIAEYKSISEATKINSFPNRVNLSHNLRGKTKSAYGYVWKYKHDNTVPS